MVRWRRCLMGGLQTGAPSVLYPRAYPGNTLYEPLAVVASCVVYQYGPSTGEKLSVLWWLSRL
eukprot:scaffold2315_cov113-Cylindrotheca_fusiformis.AAC.13